MLHRHRGNRRVLRMRAINRKRRINNAVMHNADTGLAGHFDKGKVHCSCNLCATKSTKMRNSHHSKSATTKYNSEKWYSVNDRRKFDSFRYGLSDI